MEKDPNWGRILCAIGYSGQRIDPANVAIELAAIPVLQEDPPDYDETLMEERLTAPEVKINVILQEGAGRGKAWGCDLTYDYVKINAPLSYVMPISWRYQTNRIGIIGCKNQKIATRSNRRKNIWKSLSSRWVVLLQII